MGAGGSFMRSHDDDDILGSDLDGTGHGVIKRIPIEMKPRGKLGLRSVGSLGRKPKGGSLRSALSVDLENPEVERIKKDFEMYRLNKENDIANMQKKEQKLETENKRLRAELLALQKTCTRMRAERDAALEAEQEAVARAAAFESDRDKVQRQFKLFRETKEGEIQNLLRTKREAENRLSKLMHGLAEDIDTASRSGLVDLGNANPGDWWTALESEPSLGSSAQLHQPAFLRGPEFVSTLMEMEGPFTNVTKEDWCVALANMVHIIPSIPEYAISSTLRIYISATKDLAAEVDLLVKDYLLKLRSLCCNEGRDLVVIHLPCSADKQAASVELLQKIRRRQIEMSSLFLCLLGDSSHRFLNFEIKHGHLDNPGKRPSLFCFMDSRRPSQTGLVSETQELRGKIRDSGNAKIVNGLSSAARTMEIVSAEVEKILKAELGVEAREASMSEDVVFGEGLEAGMVCGGLVWDQHCDCQQLEALNYAVHASCELGFEKLYERLTAHVAAAGPVPPLLVSGASGSGRSLLLSRWIQLQQEKSSSMLVLYHFVDSSSSICADPIIMIRRLTAQLMQHVSTPPALTCDPVRLVEEFPRWLEKVSAKSPGGVILVLDSVDRFPQADVHLKWLLDPLPVDARVIVSVTESTCPQAWRSWPTVNLGCLGTKNVRELLRAELATLDSWLDAESESRILTHCRTLPTSCPLYIMLLARHLAGVGKQEVNKHLTYLLSSSDSHSLYWCVLELLMGHLDSPEHKGQFHQMLRYLCASRCGMHENELLELIPGLSSIHLCYVFHLLTTHLILKYQGGLLTFAHQQAQNAVHEFCFGQDDGSSVGSIRQELVDYFSKHLQAGQVTARVSEELPWLIKQQGRKDALQFCILNLCIFQHMYAKGRCSELISYWQYIGADKPSMADAYFSATKRMEEDGQIALPSVADMYEILGRFLKDLGLLSQALPALQRALELRETAVDPDHPIVARSLHQLAGLHAQWGKFSTAELLYRQALDIFEDAFGSDHHLVAKELDALAVLYQKQDKHDAADPLKKRALSIKKKIRTPRGGPSGHHKIDPLQRRALQLEELAMGPDSADLARTLNELGVLYYLQNSVETAESFFKRSLEMRESVLGPDHPDIAQSLNNLAALYNDRKQYDKAEPLYERALKIRSKHSSADSPGVAAVIKHLAMLYKKQGKLDKAEPLYLQAVEIREKAFGPNHPSVATALVSVAVLYSQQNKHSDAEPLYERALRIYEDSFGPHHPRVAETLRNLAVLKYEQKDYETAARYYKRATDIKEQEATYAHKGLSRRSSSGDTNSTVKNLMQV
ncbi:nephrocystin-3-like isoform X2 [Babylonia areolata]|uniref:nephrocystin-3-like isoform X2 n=1 Tax=Babylonia areolata TaxID=304850 RepID=UPI003FD343A0